MLTLSQRERDRLVAVRQVVEGHLTMEAGARKYGVGLRHMRRIVRRYEQAQEEERDAVVMHGLRGRPRGLSRLWRFGLRRLPGRKHGYLQPERRAGRTFLLQPKST